MVYGRFLTSSCSAPGRGVGQNGAVISTAQMKELRTELTTAGVFRHHEAASWGKLAFMLAVIGVLVHILLGV